MAAVPPPRATLCRLHQSAYAVGHVLNDLVRFRNCLCQGEVS